MGTIEIPKKSDTYSLRVTPEIVEALKAVAAKYSNKIDFANDIISRLSVDETEKDNQIAFLKNRVEELNDNANALADLSKDNVVVPVTPFQRKCLNYLLERERKHLGVGEELNEAIVYNYILDEILIEGNKFSIKSIPDRIIYEFKKELGEELNV